MNMRRNRNDIKSMILLCLLLCVSAVFAGCAKKEAVQEKQTGYKIYYTNTDATQLVSENYDPKATQPEQLIQELFDQLNKAPKEVTHKIAIPEDVILKDYTLTKDGQLTLNFDANYITMSQMEEIFCRAAIVKTLGQIKGVEYIQFTVNEQPLMNAGGKQIGFMKRDNFIDSTGGKTQYTQEVTMTLYFANKEGNRLVSTRIKKMYNGTIPMEQLIIEQLIKGPNAISGADDKKIYPTVPSSTVLNKVSTKDGICYVDVNSKFLEKLSDVSEEVAVYSIVNSLAEMPSINQVKFLINGEERKKYRETLEFNGYFERNLDLVLNKE